MPLPKPSSGSTPPSRPSSDGDERGLDLYKIAVDEYRFQVGLNWNRTQYFLALNAALVAISTGLAIDEGTQSRIIAGGLYVAGATAAVMCALSCRIQHQYYRQARDRMVRLGDGLELGDGAVRTTPGSGGATRSAGSVTTFTTTMLAMLALLNVVGVVVIAIDLTA